MKQFEVTMECIVFKTLTVECDTEDEAKRNPWGHVVDETGGDLLDWEILSVKEREKL